MDSRKQEEALNALRSNGQAQMIQDIMQKMSDNCFKVCAGKRGDRLDSSEMYCMNNCFDRYTEAMQVVSKTLMEQQSQ
jgi:import inner membrane translocase subunit TIM13